jgi:hypothetical protein
MKALTIWQPWASLIMIGAKPFEFRRWDFRAREPSLVGERIVIHAGTRPMKADEIEDLIERLSEYNGAGTGMDARKALPLVQRIRESFAETPASVKRRRRARPMPVLPGIDVPVSEPPPAVVRPGQILPLGAGLGTAILGKPRRCTDLFRGKVADSDRIDEHMWAWPLTDIEPFDPAIEMRGAQGFWTWPIREAA